MIAPTLVYQATSGQVARALFSAGAYCIRLSRSQWFKWKSEIEAPVYMDCRVLAGHPGECAVVKMALGSAIRASYPNCEYVIGMAEAGIIWSTLAADQLSLPHAFVRKTMKDHGRPDWIECSPPRGVRAVLVDDLTASGQTLEDAITKVRQAGIEVIGIQSIVNWNFYAMAERFRKLGIPVRALVSYPELLAEAVKSNLLTALAVNELKRFYQNPIEHQWNLSALCESASKKVS